MNEFVRGFADAFRAAFTAVASFFSLAPSHLARRIITVPVNHKRPYVSPIMKQEFIEGTE